MVWILKIDHFGEFCYQSLRLARIRHCVLRLKSSLKTRCKIRLRGFWKSCSAQHDHQMMKMDDDIYFLSKIHSNPSAKNGVCANCHPSICLLSTTHPLRRARFYMSSPTTTIIIISKLFEQAKCAYLFIIFWATTLFIHSSLLASTNYFGKIDLNDHNYPFFNGEEAKLNNILQQVLSLLR